MYTYAGDLFSPKTDVTSRIIALPSMQFCWSSVDSWQYHHTGLMHNGSNNEIESLLQSLICNVL